MTDRIRVCSGLIAGPVEAERRLQAVAGLGKGASTLIGADLHRGCLVRAGLFCAGGGSTGGQFVGLVERAIIGGGHSAGSVLLLNHRIFHAPEPIM